MVDRNDNCLIVFAKPPVEGKVKTRLGTVLGHGFATELYRCFLLDALDQYVRIGFPIRLYFSDGQIPAALRESIAGFEVMRQRGEGLGQRMANAFLDTFASGFNAAVVIGTDHPSLPDAFIRRAFDELAPPQGIVVGPSYDGGYYVLGMNHFYGEVFDGMRYSHGDVFDQTIDRANNTRATVTVLPMWYDVDTPETLGRLLADLRSAPKRAPRTVKLMQDLGPLLKQYSRVRGANEEPPKVG